MDFNDFGPHEAAQRTRRRDDDQVVSAGAAGIAEVLKASPYGITSPDLVPRHLKYDEFRIRIAQ
ncbi:MAG: hypothetical protein O9330_10125 [Beijerinckiaceae bacterium]|nr:hypothetical protein [Beijerinckiaceae bacterium]